MDYLFPPRDVSKSRSLSPSRPSKPPQLPTGHGDNKGPAVTGTQAKLPAGQKKSCVDSGAAKLYEKATELRSSLDVPSFRVPIVREGEWQDSISLPSSPAGSRKIGLSYLTPPTSRKIASCVSPSHLTKAELSKPFTFPAVKEQEQDGRSGPFTSVLKSGSGSESLHSDSKERGGQRISRLDSGYTSGGSASHTSLAVERTEVRRGVSPTPLNNLKIVNQEPTRQTGRSQLARESQEMNRFVIMTKIDWLARPSH